MKRVVFVVALAVLCASAFASARQGASGGDRLTSATFENMQLRNIGIVGYDGVFPIATLLLAILFHQAKRPQV